MADNIDSAVSSLSEQTKKLEIAAHYTFGDAEKAKQMVAGTYKDLFVIKGRFLSSSLNGAFLIFLNGVYNQVQHIYVFLTRSFTVKELKTTVNWRNYEKEIQEQEGAQEHDTVLENQMRDAMVAGFNVQFAKELIKLIDAGDEISVNRIFQKFVKERMGYQNVDMSVDYEQITSLDMESYSVTSVKISAIVAQKKKEEEEKRKKEAAKGDEGSPLAGKEVKLVLQGNVILSPIKGKDISKISNGDKIRISITDSNPKAIQVAQAFNAYKDNTLMPISGRVVYIKHQDPTGYQIYALVAKGIYVKIDEEEENIKIALDQQSIPVQKEESSNATRIFLTVAAVIVALAVIGYLISMLF